LAILALRTLDLSQKRVVIDPGHGGIDGGTHDRDGLLEKDINLEVALLLKQFLESKSIQVVMTRDTDTSLEEYSDLKSSRYKRDLDARKKIANQSRADVLISLHVNARPKEPASRGVLVFYDLKAQRGKELATSISQAINLLVFQEFLATDAVRSKIQSGNFFILRETSIPGSLVELGFITNPEDKKLIQDQDYKKWMAFAIGIGIIDYFGGESRFSLGKSTYLEAEDVQMVH